MRFATYNAIRFASLLVSVNLLGCERATTNVDQLQTARRQISQSNLPAAVDAIAAALGSDEASPSDILASDAFAPLRESPIARSKLRDVMSAHAGTGPVSMVPPSEPGEPVRLTIRIIDEATQKPIEGALVEIVHADANGRYSKEETDWNPRLFGYARTDSRGSAMFRSIHPKGYPEAAGEMGVAHFHYRVWAEGYRPRFSELLIDGDPNFGAAERSRAHQEGVGVLRFILREGTLCGEATIPLQRDGSSDSE